MSLLLLLKCGFFLWHSTVNGSFSKTLFLVSVQARGGVTEAGDDYWDEDYDSDKNCEQEEKIAKLSIEVDAHDQDKDSVDYD